MRSSGETIASALKATDGAAMRMQARMIWVRSCTSGWFWQLVPMRFQVKAMASRRKTSTPLFASQHMRSTNSHRTSGFAQFRSHW